MTANADAAADAQSPQERAQIYWLLSTLCSEAPSVELLSELIAASSSGDRDSVGGSLLTEDIVEALERDDGMADLQQQLAREFVKLFRGIQEGLGPPPPYESLYTGAVDPLAAIASVTDFYRRAGFSQIPGVDDQADHLAAELRFLALLSMAEADALKAGEGGDSDRYRRLRLSFLDRHIGIWITDCRQALYAAAEQPFYKNLIDTVAKMISIDRASSLNASAC
jgi:TorA maturation chaperone TorD